MILKQRNINTVTFQSSIPDCSFYFDLFIDIFSQTNMMISLQTALLTEKSKKTRMEEDMEHLVQSIGDI